MKKCDGCGKEFDGPGLIIGHLKDNPEVDVILCNECVGTLYREVIKELLKGEKQNNDSNGN